MKLKPRPVTAEEMALAREDRVKHAKELIEETGAQSLILFTVIKPGPDKITPETQGLFASGRRAIEDALLGCMIAPLQVDSRELVTGREYYIALYLPAMDAKRRMCEIEDILPFGRLLNINVFDADGSFIPRTALGYPERCCLVCGKPGYECARTGAHTLEEVEEIADIIMEEAQLTPD